MTPMTARATVHCSQCGARRTAANPLTPKQRDLLLFLEAHADHHGYAPSFDEIAAHFGYKSLATVHEHLETLERKGWIRRAPNEARAIEVLYSVAANEKPLANERPSWESSPPPSSEAPSESARGFQGPNHAPPVMEDNGFRKGDRVRLSQEAIRGNVAPRAIGRVATVMSQPRHSADLVTVCWDGNTSFNRFHRTFLEVASDPSIAPAALHPRGRP